MATHRKNLLIGIFILGVVILFWVATFYARAPRYFWHLGYQIFPVCWSCEHRIWAVDEVNSVRISYPENWEIKQADEFLVIQPTKFVDSNMWIMVKPISLTTSDDLDLTKHLEVEINWFFANYKEYDVIGPTQEINFDGNTALKTKVRAIPHIKMEDEVLKDLLGDAAPIYVQDSEMFLVDSDEQDFLIGTIYRSGTPDINPWGYDQIQMILNSIRFE